MRHTLDRAEAQQATSSTSITIATTASSPEKFSNETPAQKAKHEEIARRYAWDDRDRDERARYPLIAALRLRNLENLFAYRYGPTLPDDDAGRSDLYIVASHVLRFGAPEVHIPAWVRLWCPWLGEEECAKLIADVKRERKYWDADALGEELNLTDDVRTALEITTIGAVDCSKAKRVRRAKSNDAHYQRVKRAEAGAKPQAMSTERTAPWKDLGISRRTYYRKGLSGTGTDSSGADRVLVGTTKQCQGAPPPLRGGTWARAVPALSAVDRAISTDTGLSPRVFPNAARESKMEKPSLAASSVYMHGVAQIGNAPPPQKCEVSSMPKIQAGISLRKLTPVENQMLAARSKVFDKLRREYPNNPPADAAEVEVLFNEMLLDRHSFGPLIKTVAGLANVLHDGRIRHEDLPSLKNCLFENWEQVHGGAPKFKLRIAA
jgi:hypothetical protein